MNDIDKLNQRLDILHGRVDALSQQFTRLDREKLSRDEIPLAQDMPCCVQEPQRDIGVLLGAFKGWHARHPGRRLAALVLYSDGTGHLQNENGTRIEEFNNPDGGVEIIDYLSRK